MPNSTIKPFQKRTGLVTYIRAADLTETEVQQVLELVSPRQQRYLRVLLVQNKNEPSPDIYLRDSIDRVLRANPVNGKTFHIARRTSFSQLWEVSFTPRRTILPTLPKGAGILSFI